jgi:hypothetical protein
VRVRSLPHHLFRFARLVPVEYPPADPQALRRDLQQLVIAQVLI